MSNGEARERIHAWLTSSGHGAFSWPTDACSYDQTIRFALYRNRYWQGGSHAEFMEFVQQYAESLKYA